MFVAMVSVPAYGQMTEGATSKVQAASTHAPPLTTPPTTGDKSTTASPLRATMVPGSVATKEVTLLRSINGASKGRPASQPQVLVDMPQEQVGQPLILPAKK